MNKPVVTHLRTSWSKVTAKIAKKELVLIKTTIIWLQMSLGMIMCIYCNDTQTGWHEHLLYIWYLLGKIRCRPSWPYLKLELHIRALSSAWAPVVLHLRTLTLAFHRSPHTQQDPAAYKESLTTDVTPRTSSWGTT